MPFSENEREALLATRLVGPKVIERLEQIGCDSFVKLREADATALCQVIAAELGVTCWKNSPMAQNAIRNAIDTAKSHVA
jgi:hypothetical protein